MSEGRNGSFSRKNDRETSPADESHCISANKFAVSENSIVPKLFKKLSFSP